MRIQAVPNKPRCRGQLLADVLRGAKERRKVAERGERQARRHHDVLLLGSRIADARPRKCGHHRSPIRYAELSAVERESTTLPEHERWYGRLRVPLFSRVGHRRERYYRCGDTMPA